MIACFGQEHLGRSDFEAVSIADVGLAVTGSSRRGENIMLFIVGAVIVVIAIVKIPGMRLPRSGSDAHLGWMSEQWLAEFRASHPS